MGCMPGLLRGYGQVEFVLVAIYYYQHSSLEALVA